MESFFKNKDDTAVENNGASTALISPEQKRIWIQKKTPSSGGKNIKKYPILSAVVKKYLSILATSTPSERLFNQAGNIVTSLWNILRQEMVDM